MLIITTCCRHLAGSPSVPPVTPTLPHRERDSPWCEWLESITTVVCMSVCRVQPAVALLYLLLPAPPPPTLLFCSDSTTSDSLKSKVSQPPITFYVQVVVDD